MATPESPEISHIVKWTFIDTARKTFQFFLIMIFVNDSAEADDEEHEDNCKHNHI